ncbi:MAG: DUF3322 domain-containing protein [Pirellulaceae bacterium]|nr:hypothetical protein [Planctomycetales bacterium]
MKSPSELRTALQRQWQHGDKREARLLGGQDAWPIVLPIGRPSAAALKQDLDGIRRHVVRWRQVAIGEVLWEPIRYRATSGAVEIPVEWKLRRPSEWMEACASASIRQEFLAMSALVERTDAAFHSLLIRRRSLWQGKPLDEIVTAASLSMELLPGCAAGRPLRLLSREGIDTKFFERHGQLVTALLDVRFDGEVSQIGLESFLGATTEGDHWLLVVDLDGSLMPFRKLRVRGSELRQIPLPGSRLLVVENEACQHLLPGVSGAVAVLGAGSDLGWMEAEWLTSKRVAYWGDLDTWGLQFLARARIAIGRLDPLLMTEAVLDRYSDLAVAEPIGAGMESPVGLSTSESVLYQRLLHESRGRLEQERLPEELVRTTILNWAR